MADAQAESRPLTYLSGGKEGVKYLLKVLLGYSRTIIFKRYADSITYRFCLNEKVTSPMSQSHLCVSIHDYIEKHLLKQSTISHNQGQVRVKLSGSLYVTGFHFVGSHG